MISQKVAQQSLRRFAVQRPYAMQWSLTNCASPAAVALGRNVQIRTAASTTNPTDPSKNLAQQRLNRPVAPHLSIYQPQITWIGSATGRVTGLALSGSLYLFATAYLVSPAFGWHLESASIAAAFGALPFLVKAALKTIIAWPFTFHSLNGVRHLVWDLGFGFTNQQVIKTGWTVVSLSVISALLLGFF